MTTFHSFFCSTSRELNRRELVEVLEFQLSFEVAVSLSRAFAQPLHDLDVPVRQLEHRGSFVGGGFPFLMGQPRSVGVSLFLAYPNPVPLDRADVNRLVQRLDRLARCLKGALVRGARQAQRFAC